jgi:hypothetical protein
MLFGTRGDSEKTEEPYIKIEGGLEPGRYLFRLEVVNRRGEVSAPDERWVEIVDQRFER